MRLEALFTREILLWRYMEALMYLLALEVLVPLSVCNLHHTVIIDGVFNPLVIATNLTISIISPTRIMILAIPATCLVLLARIHVKSFAVVPWLPKNRWDTCRRLLSPVTLVHCSIIIAACAVLASFYASLARPDIPIAFLPCQPGDMVCFKRKTLILTVGGYIGVRYACRYFLNNGNLIIPAPAHPHKLQLIRSKLNFKMVVDACGTYGVRKFPFVLLITAYMAAGIVSSLWTGGDWKDWLVVFDVSLMLLAVLVAVLLSVTLALFLEVFQIFISQPIQIPIATAEDDTTESDGDSWRLCHALGSSGLLQLLSFWDLKTVASSNPKNFQRRSQVFAISQPGGHPRNWLGIMNPSLNLIRKFTERLRRHNCPEDFPQDPTPVTAPTDLNKNEVPKQPTVTLKERVGKIVSGLKQYPVFGYLLCDLPDATNRSIFAEALPVVWAVGALGDLIAASFTEDKFGVVQRNIPDILTAFVQLQKVIDGLSRGTLARRAGTGEPQPVELQLRKALRSSLRSTLYTITSTFGTTILEMQLSSECRAKLQSYLDFKEG